MVVCLATLMIVLDTTIVNVALPSIKLELGFSDVSLTWIINAYLLTFGGFLLLGGRLGDLYGQRNLFICGVTLFTLASLACGLAANDAWNKSGDRKSPPAVFDHPAYCNPSPGPAVYMTKASSNR